LLIPLDFLAFVRVLQYMKLPSLLYTCQVYFSATARKRCRRLKLEVVDCVKRVPILALKQDDPSLCHG